MQTTAPAQDRQRNRHRPDTIARGVTGAVVLVVLLLAAPPLSNAQNPDAQNAEQIKRQLDSLTDQIGQEKQQESHLNQEARRLAAEEQTLRDRIIAAARRSQDLESALTRLEQDISGLAKREAEAKTRLESKAGQHVDILMALQRLANTPPEILMALPRGPQDQLRTASVLKAALPAVDHHARLLKNEIAGIAVLREALVNKQAELAKTTRELGEEHLGLETLLAQKRSLRRLTDKAFDQTRREVAMLANEAKSLSGLLNKLNRFKGVVPAPRERPHRAPESGPGAARKDLVSAAVLMGGTVRPLREVKGQLPPPARGRLTTKFGERRATGGPVEGVKSQGVELKTRINARVVAPYQGRIVYAGPFRGYRLLLIIEHDGGYHSLLAGLARIDSRLGQWVLAGEPVGAMGEQERVLYLEMRQQGKPFDPLPWLESHYDEG